MPPVGYRPNVLAAMPGTRAEIMEKVCIAPRTLTGILSKALAEDACYVWGWRRSNGSGNFQPIYVAGPGVSVPCTLKKWTDAQIGRRYWKKIKQDERGDVRKAKDAAKYYAKKAAKKPAGVFNALFVMLREVRA